jgi:mannose-6-phosphate isomerase-like protein (cupin superfamily)
MTLKLAVAAALLGGLAASSAFAFESIISLPSEQVTIHPNGNPDQVLATREQTDGQLGVIILSDSGPDGGPGPAIVQGRGAELWYVLEGTYVFHVGDKVVEGGPGTFVAVDAGQPHGFTTKTAGRLLTIYSPGGYEHFFIDWDKLGLKEGPDLGKLENDYGVTRP